MKHEQQTSRREKSSTFFGGNNFSGLNLYCKDNVNMTGKPPVTYESIIEGHAPHLLYWSFGPLNPFRPPRPEDFTMQDGRRVFGTGDSRKEIKPFASRSLPWLQIEYNDVMFTQSREEDTDFFRWETRQGTLTARRHENHMVEFPVKSITDIPLWHTVQKNLVYRRHPDFSADASASRREIRLIWSPVQELLQFVTGVENFYYLMADAPDQMRAMLETMHGKNLDALAIGYQACPNAKLLFLNENTSSQIISPDFFRQLSLPHIRTYVESAHQRGLSCVAHMCGHLTALLDCIAETGLDGIQSLTPPPIGDTHFTVVRRRFGDEFVIIGRLNAQLFMDKESSAILKLLEEMIPESLIHTPFGLWVTADEMQPSAETVYALVEALEEYNRRHCVQAH
jgi:hypothetical protein